MVNGSRSNFIGKGTVKVKMFDGVIQTLGDIRYVP